MHEAYDIAVIGGGINGSGIARDAAGRGLSVYLCEANDLASGTSSASTKLIHGGLRYLEYYKFRLVRQALMEREVLWRIAPHVITPARFILPHNREMRRASFLRLGLFIYDHLGKRRLLPPSRTLDLVHDAAGQPLKRDLFRKGFEYSDCRVDDARLVVLNARDAAARGAVIETRTAAISAQRGEVGWLLSVENRMTSARRSIQARVVINAAGPWVSDVLLRCFRLNGKAKVRLVQGSHIVVRKLYDHDRCYIFQHTDGRVVFAIPFEREFTLIGTTDRDYDGDPRAVRATEEEIDYLCNATSGYFASRIRREDVVWTYSGVRPLYDDDVSDATAASRDYVFDLDESQPSSPILTIFGGKITTYRRLAEAALSRLGGLFPAMGPRWTAAVPLPGGDFDVDGLGRLVNELCAAYPFLSAHHAERLASAYGTHAYHVLGSARHKEDLGQHFGATLTEAEIRWLMNEEWAACAEDVIWRRSKLGLFLSQDEVDAIAAFMSTV